MTDKNRRRQEREMNRTGLKHLNERYDKYDRMELVGQINKLLDDVSAEYTGDVYDQ